MICASFLVNAEGKYIGFNIEGHSGYAEHGRDIICAAVSVLAQATFYGIQSIIGANISGEIDSKEPRMAMAVLDKGEKLEKSQIMLSTMAYVIAEIAGQYPENVSFSITNVDVCEV